MGWRDRLRVRMQTLGTDRVDEALLRMGPEHRIALARELLAGTGRVVAREVVASNICEGWWHGWNACRAAMMDDTR